MRAALASLAGLALSACGGPPVPGVDPPSPYLMAPPAPFPSLTTGEDKDVILLQAAAAHNKNARKIKGLQKYVRLVQKGK